MIRFPLTSILMTLALLAFASTTRAEEEAVPAAPATAPHSAIMPVKIKPVQEGADGVSKAAPDIEQQNDIDADTLALYSTQSDGSFGPNLWKGMSREEVIKGIHALPVPQSSPATRELTLRVILSKADVPPSSAKPPEPGVFAARMSKLVEMGAYREAMSLYEKLDSPAVNAEAALAGMKAFIGNGQVAIACLEQKALDQSLKSDDPFWKHLDVFCQNFIKVDNDMSGDDSQSLMRASLAYVASEKTVSPAQFEDLNNRTLIELLVLSKAGILDRGKWSVMTAGKLSPAVVSFLLALQPTNVEQKLSLFTVAVDDGLRSPDDLAAAYKEVAASTTPHGDWAPFLNAFSKISVATSDAEKLKLLKPLLANVTILTPSAYAPLVPVLTELKPATPLTPDDARMILRVFINAGAQIPPHWVAYAYEGLEAPSDSGESLLIEAWNNGAKTPLKDGEKPPAQPKAAKPKLTPELAYVLILQAYLQPEAKDEAAEKPAYDNFLSLTGVNNYVMPSGELTESLKKAAQAGSLGKILLYSLQTLNGQPLDQVHPQALSQVLKALKTAGLSEETVSLAHEALEGLTTKKEN